MVTYGTRILQRTHFQKDLYTEKYKGIGVSLEMFSHGLHGGYTNFGVFELYQDNSLANSMSLALRMCLAIPLEDLMAYPKTLKPYFFFLELASRGHMARVLELDSPLLARLLQVLSRVIVSPPTNDVICDP